MAYLDKEHLDRIDEFNQLWNGLERLNQYGLELHQIGDVTQDNGLKLLETLTLFNLTNNPDREGCDAFDAYGHAWELKTINIDSKSNPQGFSTNHHVNNARIEAFRKERWLFSIYHGIHLDEVYAVSPKDLEDYFVKWEKDLNKQIEDAIKNGDPIDKIHKNNPKISIKKVKQRGVKIFPFESPPIDPAEALKEI